MCLVVLLGFMGWLVMMIAPDRDAKSKSGKPSHFTIPILSPFASVVRFRRFFTSPGAGFDLHEIGRTRDWYLWHQSGRYLGRGYRNRNVCGAETSVFSVAHTMTGTAGPKFYPQPAQGES